MATTHGLLMFLWQSGTDTQMATDVHWIMIVEVFFAVVLLLMLIGMGIAALKVMSLAKKAEAMTENLERHVWPLLGKVNGLVDEMTPTVRKVAADTQQIIAVVKEKSTEVGATVTKINGIVNQKSGEIGETVTKINGIVNQKSGEIGETVSRINEIVAQKSGEISETISKLNQTVVDVNQKARGQVDHVNGIVNDALNATAHLKDTVKNGIMAPVRHASGLVAGFRTTVESLIKRYTPGPKKRPSAAPFNASDPVGSATNPYRGPAGFSGRGGTSPYDL